MKRLRLLHWVMVVVALVGGIVPGVQAQAGEEQFRAQRERLITEIEADVKQTSERIGRKSLAPLVMDAMRRVPRHEFIPDGQKPYAYDNRPLPIGYGQTISQPYIVAVMTDLADVAAGKTVLEVGTGSGYQAAILAACGAQVYTLEIIPELARQAQEPLQRLGYVNVAVRTGDGYYGWPERAPFDAILVTAASSHIPPPLIEQLKPGGKMVIPVGGPFMTQQLMLVEKAEDGKITTRQLLPVAFVPLTGGH
jgi:protein-L-isoaspartate(D-aspartate) O-methyltransferase